MTHHLGRKCMVLMDCMTFPCENNTLKLGAFKEANVAVRHAIIHLSFCYDTYFMK